jgi:hypothetical protein
MILGDALSLSIASKVLSKDNMLLLLPHFVDYCLPQPFLLLSAAMIATVATAATTATTALQLPPLPAIVATLPQLPLP